ncbi:Gfo/Idh/MocA family oxidoreductase [Streptomyces palmae]|uniref:Gfo/Idh/MocA family oxidoreductase n=1 Tax=Streptomyces palmae TaxID=1701085 RepID=A0A4Z0HH46_9ACTN|nr:Gfo/Idh/MocA family oxidoreductase [Streptomyces palmae]
MRIGIVGLGVISRFYVAAFEEVDGVELAAVCDLRPDALAPFQGRAACYTDHRTMIAEAELDAVVVNVPNDVHAQVCGDLLAAGLPVCVEKPLATRVEDGRALVRAARNADLVLFTSFHRRYNDNALALLERVREHGSPIESLTVRYLETIEEHAGTDHWYLDPERCGGGCVADNGPNAFDTVRQFIGPTQVTAAAVVRDRDGIDRQATVQLRSAAGATAQVLLDWSYPGERKDIEVTLADGTHLAADMLGGHQGFKQSLWHEYAGVLREFADAVRSGEDRAAGGIAALELVADVYRREAEARPGYGADSARTQPRQAAPTTGARS